MRIAAVVLVALLAFSAGVWAAPFVVMAADREPEGHALRCVAHGRVCVGMEATHALSSSAEDNFGGLINVYCGFDRLGGAVGAATSLAEIIGGGCSGNRYVAQFSDGKHLTSVWVDSTKIVQIDRVQRHTLDF